MLKKLWKRLQTAIADVLIIPIRIYQHLVSPLIPPRCRFTPTCSAYAVTALKKFGPVRGILMACCRCARCQPFCKAGFDPVPDKFTLKPFAGVKNNQ